MICGFRAKYRHVTSWYPNNWNHPYINGLEIDKILTYVSIYMMYVGFSTSILRYGCPDSYVTLFGLVFYNPGKKGWDSLSDLVQRGSPLSPNAMLIRVMFQKPRQVAQHWLMGVGKDMTNGELGGFFKTMHCPKCPSYREHWDNCNKVYQVSQLFFSRIVAWKCTFAIFLHGGPTLSWNNYHY